MEKVYRFLDYYALTASAGIALAVAAFLATRPHAAYGATAAAAGAVLIALVAQLTCGYVRVYALSDEGFAAVCWGRRKVVASRSEAKGLVKVDALMYSRLIFLKEGGRGEVEAPNYVVERLAQDAAAWWELDLVEVKKPFIWAPGYQVAAT